VSRPRLDDLRLRIDASSFLWIGSVPDSFELRDEDASRPRLDDLRLRIDPALLLWIGSVLDSFARLKVDRLCELRDKDASQVGLLGEF